MQGTVDGFVHGPVTPVAAFLVACLGAVLGLRCANRSLGGKRPVKGGWLALGAASIGTGVWAMHFIAMTGFSVAETPIGYDRTIIFAVLAVAITVAGVGIFLVGHRGTTRMAIVTAGTVTGLGMASTHYLGMAGMRLPGQLEYDTLTVVLSVVVAVVAATVALWAAVSLRGLLPGLGAGVVMGVAASGMHYTAMAAVSVRLDTVTGAVPAATGTSDTTAPLLVPMLIGPVCFLLLAGAVVLLGPRIMAGRPNRNGRGPTGPRPAGLAGLPAQGRRPRARTPVGRAGARVPARAEARPPHHG
ncbi:MHYT domain-containing protein [Streptomyces sp. DT24]|uniref:MHYT domain-containing protein n=1 Tax=Streptomyces sp. DT24 TaxID=3416520 RepID=UPI003CEC02D9